MISRQNHTGRSDLLVSAVVERRRRRKWDERGCRRNWRWVQSCPYTDCLLTRPVQSVRAGQGAHSAIKIRRIEVIFAGNAYQREQRIAPGVGEGGSHPVRGGRLADWTDWPVG